MSQFGTYPDFRDTGVSLERAKELEEQNGPYPIPVQIGPQGMGIEAKYSPLNPGITVNVPEKVEEVTWLEAPRQSEADSWAFNEMLETLEGLELTLYNPFEPDNQSAHYLRVKAAIQKGRAELREYPPKWMDAAAREITGRFWHTFPETKDALEEMNMAVPILNIIRKHFPQVELRDTPMIEEVKRERDEFKESAYRLENTISLLQAELREPRRTEPALLEDLRFLLHRYRLMVPDSMFDTPLQRIVEICEQPEPAKGEGQ